MATFYRLLPTALGVVLGRCRSGLTGSFLVLSSIVILVATLLPSEPAGEIDWNKFFCLGCGRASLADAFANIVLFLPLGAALRLEVSVARYALRCAALLSVFVELAQFAVPGRDPGLGDFIFNMIGAALGGQLVNAVRVWIFPAPRMASRLSLVAALIAGGVFVMTDILLTTSLPETTYFVGSTLLQASRNPLRLGGTADPRESFQGRIDEVRIYDRVRTAADIQADMHTPVVAAPIRHGLAAAYGFDEGSGSVLTDVSGHGNSGYISGATWTSQGKFGSALSFSGNGDVVVIPHTRSLELTGTMTLEAWIYPTAAQTGWRPILQKEFDAYFMLASSKIGALKPGGGGTFGFATEVLRSPTVVPTDTWTHVALTYDGAMLELFINGNPAARLLRWYPGRTFDASLGGRVITTDGRVDSWSLREALLAGAPLQLRTMVATRVTSVAPLFTLHGPLRDEVLLFAVEGDDVVFRLRTRAAAAEFESPAVRARDVMRGLTPGDDVTLTMRRAGRTYCLDVNTRSTCGLGFTLGMGWTLFAYSQVPPGWPHAACNAIWMAVLLFPFGFWLRRRWESLLGLVVLAAGTMLPCMAGSLSAPSADVGAGVVGILAGWACALAVARAKLHAGGATEG